MLTDYIFENVLRNPLRFLPMEIVARAARVEGALETSQLWAAHPRDRDPIGRVIGCHWRCAMKHFRETPSPRVLACSDILGLGAGTVSDPIIPLDHEAMDSSLSKFDRQCKADRACTRDRHVDVSTVNTHGRLALVQIAKLQSDS